MFILVWIGDPGGSPLKLAIEVYYTKSVEIKVMIKSVHVILCTSSTDELYL